MPRKIRLLDGVVVAVETVWYPTGRDTYRVSWHRAGQDRPKGAQAYIEDGQFVELTHEDARERQRSGAPPIPPRTD